MLPQLDALHAARVAKDKEFQWWSQDVAEFRADQAKKYVSLNEAERRVERDARKPSEVERQAQRKALGLDARSARPTTPPTTACRSASATSPPTPRARSRREASGSAAARIGRDPGRRDQPAGAATSS